jgi:hypothetical protein
MRQRRRLTCALCDDARWTTVGRTKVWFYASHADSYCARHWEMVFADDLCQHRGDSTWQTATRPQLEYTRQLLRRESHVPEAVRKARDGQKTFV